MNVGQVEFAVTADGLDAVLAKVTDLQNMLNNIDGRKYGKGIGHITSDLRSVQRELEHTFVNFGSRMQTLGRTIQNITMPFHNIVRGIGMGVGYRALNKVLDGFSNAFQRSDILNTTETILKLQGYDLGKKFAVGTNKAATAMENLDEAVQGLPTGLDEIVASMKVYVGASEDVEKSTKMAIAANNAYIASGVDATRKRYSERQLQNLMSGAELTSQQWDSLRKNIPLAMNAVAHELDMSMGKMISDLKNGRLETDKFLDAFIKVGTEGKIYKSAQKLKITWEALSSNISIAFSRMGANILDTANSVTKKLTGRTFLQHLLGVDAKGKDMGDGIKHIINGLSDSAQKWIKANPEKLMGFLDYIREFDWKGTFGEIGRYFGTMAKLYGGFIKLIGGKRLASFMLWGNFLGKALTVAGGLIRGLAGPLSKLASGTGLFGLSKVFGALGGAGAAMGGTSWQGVATKGIAVAAIPALAGSLVLVAKALQEFDKVEINWSELVVKLGQAATAISSFAILAGALGAVMSSTPIGWAGALIEGAGVAMITAISGAMIAVAKGLNDIAKAEIPDSAKIQQVIDAISEVGVAFEAKDPFEAIGKMFDAWSKGAEFDTVTKVTEAFKSIGKLGKIKIGQEQIDQAKANFRQIGDFISDIETIINGEEGIPGTTAGAGWRGNTNVVSNWKLSLDDFSHKITSISTALMSMQSAIDQLKALKKVKPEAIDVNAIATLANQVDSALAELEKVGKREVEIAIEITSKVTGGEDIINAVQKEVDKVETGIKNIKDRFDKTIFVYLKSGGVFGGYGVVDAVRARIADIRRRIAGINGTIQKRISITTSEDGGGSWNHAGGMITRNGAVLYRQMGGFAFTPRGTDTVPAMLTPGEYVVNRRAVGTIGADVLQRLNHLDIAGAIRELSARAGQSIVPRGNVINNTTNNTRNNNVSIHNSSSAGVGLGRANRWVMSL